MTTQTETGNRTTTKSSFQMQYLVSRPASLALMVMGMTLLSVVCSWVDIKKLGALWRDELWRIDESRYNIMVHTSTNNGEHDWKLAPPPVLRATGTWPPEGTEVFFPNGTYYSNHYPNIMTASNADANPFQQYNVAAFTICCPESPIEGAQRLNSEYFPRHNMPYIVFHECGKGGAEGERWEKLWWDWERLWRMRQVLLNSNFDFVVWMDCDAAVIVGEEDDALVNPQQRFLWAFDNLVQVPLQEGISSSNDNIHMTATTATTTMTHEQQQQRRLQQDSSKVHMVITNHADYDGGPDSFGKGYCDTKYQYYPPVQQPRGVFDGCQINSGVFVMRNTPTALKTILRFEQIMTWENATSPNPHINAKIPLNHQDAFSCMMQEQVEFQKSRDHPIRVVFSQWFNRHIPPCGTNPGRIAPGSIKEFTAEWFRNAEPNYWWYWLRRDKHHYWSTVPTFMVHPWSQPLRSQFWDCAASVKPRSADRIIDTCGRKWMK